MLCLFDELGLELHRADPVDLAVDVVIAINQADVLDLGADLDDRGGALDLQILDYRDRIAVYQNIAEGILENLGLFTDFSCGFFRPLVTALRADILAAIIVSVFRTAFGALW